MNLYKIVFIWQTRHYIITVAPNKTPQKLQNPQNTWSLQ